jgi:phosphate transport system ATP-binding protein
MRAEVAIEASGLVAGFGDTEVLKGIDLEIRERRITAFIGPSGCGKSTLLRCFNRMNDHLPDYFRAGSIRIRQRDVTDPTWDLEDLRAQVGMVFQKPNPFPQSITRNVLFGPRMGGVRERARLDEILETSLRRAHLWDEVKDRLAASALELSGGQQQRLCIARALASSPGILLLDEPASALDPIATDKLEETIRELSSEVTVVLVTHNLQQAGRVAHRTAFLYLGRLVEEGETAELLAAPREKLTEDYLTGRFG